MSSQECSDVGKLYRYSDVKGGALPGVPGDRLRVELIPNP